MASHLTPQQEMDERRFGWLAGQNGEPFQAYKSAPWRLGWQMQRQQQAIKTLAENDLAEVDALLRILGHTCRRIAAKGELAADLARATADIALGVAGPDDDADAQPLPVNVVAFPAAAAAEQPA